MSYSRHYSNHRGYRGRSDGGYYGRSRRVSSSNSSRWTASSTERQVREGRARGDGKQVLAQKARKYLIEEGWFPTSDESPVRKERDGYHTLSLEPSPFGDSQAMEVIFFKFIGSGVVPEQCIVVFQKKESAEEEARRMEAEGHTNIKLHRIRVRRPQRGRREFQYRSLTKIGESLGFDGIFDTGHVFLVAHYIAEKFVRHSEPFLG